MKMVNDYWLKHTASFPLEIHNSGVNPWALIQQDFKWRKKNKIPQLTVQAVSRTAQEIWLVTSSASSILISHKKKKVITSSICIWNSSTSAHSKQKVPQIWRENPWMHVSKITLLKNQLKDVTHKIWLVSLYISFFNYVLFLTGLLICDMNTYTHIKKCKWIQ